MTELFNLPTPKLRADSRVSPARVASAALGDLLTSQAAASLSPLASGCLIALVKFAASREDLESLGSTLTLKDAQTILSMKGLSSHDSELSLSVLAMSGLVQIDGDILRIPLLDHAIRNEASTLANRVAGWRKRGAQAPAAAKSAAPAQHPAVVPPALAELHTADSTATPPATAVQPVEVVAIKPPAPAKKVSTAGARRFSVSDKESTDPATDPVLVRVLCENGQVAEITGQYVAHLQDNFKSLDALVQLRRAALWCESNPKKRKTFNGMRKFLTTWLSSAAREADVRNAVVRVGNQKNGFGQGGDYSTSAASSDDNQGSLPLAAADSSDDFLDLVPAETVRATTAALPAAAPAPVAERPTVRVEEARATVPEAPAARPSQTAALAARVNERAERTAAAAARANSARQSGPARGSFLSQTQR